MKVYKVELLIIDHDDIGPQAVKDELEVSVYSNHCIHPQVMDIKTKTVKWSDNHPLNQAYHDLFQDII